jgi:hypothetical protein
MDRHSTHSAWAQSKEGDWVNNREWENPQDIGREVWRRVTGGETDHSNVKSPDWYTWIPGIETKMVTSWFPWAEGNALKYIWRADHKGKYIEDIDKAIECLQIAKAHFLSKQANTVIEGKQEEM